jgi:prephenate dehydrogenase
MWLDILLTNGDLLEAARDFQRELNVILDLIEKRDESGLLKLLSPAREQRAQMYKFPIGPKPKTEDG